MKAKEYFAKYGDRLVANDFDHSEYDVTTAEGRDACKDAIEKHINKALSDMIIEMSTEIRTIMEQRKCRTNEAVAAVVREMNDRFNVVARMLKEKNEFDVLKPNGLARYWVSEIPELERYLRIKFED